MITTVGLFEKKTNLISIHLKQRRFKIFFIFLQFSYQDVSQLRSWIFGEENLTRKDIIVQPSVHEQEDGYKFLNLNNNIF